MIGVDRDWFGGANPTTLPLDDPTEMVEMTAKPCVLFFTSVHVDEPVHLRTCFGAFLVHFHLGLIAGNSCCTWDVVARPVENKVVGVV
jgi:hypothetical protein